MISKRLITCVFFGFVFEHAFSMPDVGQTGGADVTSGSVTITSNMYPNARRDEKITDTYAKNTVVHDPYRWLETPNEEERKTYFGAQNTLTRSYLDKAPSRTEIEARYKELNNYPKYKGPYKHGKKYYSFQNTGAQNQDVFYVQDSLKAKPEVFIDPNALSKDGTIALDFETSSFSPDGLIFAYSLTRNGSDRMEVHFKHVEQGDIYKETLTEVRDTTLEWTHDNKGIFYGRYLGDSPEHESVQNQKVFYHKVGTDQKQDVLVVEFTDKPDYLMNIRVTDDGNYLVVTPTDGSPNNVIYVADLKKINFEIKEKLKLIPIVTKLEATYELVANVNKTLIFRTNKDADKYKLAKIDIPESGNPDPKSWKDLVPAHEKDILDFAAVTFEKFLVISYIHDAKSVLQLHDLETGRLSKKFDLKEEMGKVDYVSTSKSSSEIFFKVITFLCPGIVYRVDLSATKSFDLEVIQKIEVKNFDADKFITEQVFIPSKDKKTQVPMFLIHKTGLPKNGNNPVILYGFGAFGFSQLPKFSVNKLVFIENLDGIFAVANIRGGGEYGEEWHKDGSANKRQNSFDDFQAAAEYLIKEKFTSKKLLAIDGKAAGGLLTGACLNQRPDLYGAVVIEQGLLDMLRYNVFTEDGKTWTSEFGSAANDTDFPYIYKISPLHNIKLPKNPCDQYPTTLITTSEDDNRLPHALKFAATLQNLAKGNPNQKNPLLIKIGTNTGNGGNKPTEKEIADNVDVLCFIVNALGIKYHC